MLNQPLTCEKRRISHPKGLEPKWPPEPKVAGSNPAGDIGFTTNIKVVAQRIVRDKPRLRAGRAAFWPARVCCKDFTPEGSPSLSEAALSWILPEIVRVDCEGRNASR